MLPRTPNGRSGVQKCNLTEINGGVSHNKKQFLKQCRVASIIGTLQAGYTNFKYLSPETREIVEREALIGVSITGWMNNPRVLFNENNMREGAKVVKDVNKQVAELIDINPAARTTCVKPSGNASVLLGTASGIHGEHSPMYFRNVQMNKDSGVAALIKKTNPHMVEDSVWSANGTDCVVAFPVESPEGSKYKDDLYGAKQLEFVKKAQQVWVEEGTNVELCTDPRLRHNVSNTIVVDDWDEVAEYVYNNRQWFAGISFLAATGDKDYPQAPFTEVLEPEDLVVKYGEASMFASGLIVEALEGFGDLWAACSTAVGVGEELGDLSHHNLTKHDFVRRLHKFADNYFAGDVKVATYCLKDVYNLHKWSKIKRNMTDIDWKQALTQEEYVDIDTTGAVACSGGACEI